MNPEQYRDVLHVALASLAGVARSCFTHEEYEEALDQAERTVMNALYDCWRNPTVGIDQHPVEGTWVYHHKRTKIGHLRLVDQEGRLVGIIGNTHDGRWEAYMQPDWRPQIEKKEGDG